MACTSVVADGSCAAPTLTYSDPLTRTNLCLFLGLLALLCSRSLPRALLMPAVHRHSLTALIPASHILVDPPRPTAQADVCAKPSHSPALTALPLETMDNDRDCRGRHVCTRQSLSHRRSLSGSQDADRRFSHVLIAHLSAPSLGFSSQRSTLDTGELSVPALTQRMAPAALRPGTNRVQTAALTFLSLALRSTTTSASPLSHDIALSRFCHLFRRY